MYHWNYVEQNRIKINMSPNQKILRNLKCEISQKKSENEIFINAKTIYAKRN